MDFGLARALDGSVPTTWPHFSGRAGTVECMAPEQIAGNPVGTAADIYAFGIILFEMLTARRPFHRSEAAARLSKDPPLLSSLVPSARDWEPLVSRCLQRRPEDRFSSLDEMLAAMPRPGQRLPLQGADRRWLWLAAALAALGTAALIARG
jgi:serine/threonine protein kinase